MDPWRVVEMLAAALAAVLAYLAKETASDAKQRIGQLEREVADVRREAARSEERDKSFAENITRLTKAIDDFDTRIGKQIFELKNVVSDMARRFSPARGIPAVRAPIPLEDKEG